MKRGEGHSSTKEPGSPSNFGPCEATLMKSATAMRVARVQTTSLIQPPTTTYASSLRPGPRSSTSSPQEAFTGPIGRPGAPAATILGPHVALQGSCILVYIRYIMGRNKWRRSRGSLPLRVTEARSHLELPSLMASLAVGSRAGGASVVIRPACALRCPLGLGASFVAGFIRQYPSLDTGSPPGQSSCGLAAGHGGILCRALRVMYSPSPMGISRRTLCICHVTFRLSRYRV